MSDLWDDRRVVITGAAGGIGRAVAADLAGRGARLTLVGRRARPLEQLAGELPGWGHRAVAIDVADEEAWIAATPELAPDGAVHGLVTAAGELGPIGPVGSWRVAELRRTLDVNIVGTVIPLVALLDRMRAGGSVVAFSGGGATATLPRYNAYAASKAAVVRLVENLAGDLAPRGLRINAVAPGFVATGIHQATIAAGPDRAGPAYFQRTLEAMDAGDPPELAARLTAFLLSDDAEGITGRLISARWDPWTDPQFQQRLRDDPDLATLRRIDDQFFTGRSSSSRPGP